MDSSSAQEMGSQTLESMVACRHVNPQQEEEKKAKGADMQALKCPRCDSTNTKFCYYNNYSLSQPRYFCKSCRRYWTKGGTLRNVPVGGGCRKNKRSSSSSSKRTPDPTPFSYESNDLTLAIARLQKQSYGDDFSVWGNPHHHGGGILGNLDNNNSGLFRTGFVETPAPNLYYGNLEFENNGGGMGMGIPFEDFSGGATTASTAVTTVKQEICGGSREGESRVLWGFPWQSGGGAELDSGRVSWASNWQALLNSPLM